MSKDMQEEIEDQSNTAELIVTPDLENSQVVSIVFSMYLNILITKIVSFILCYLAG